MKINTAKIKNQQTIRYTIFTEAQERIINKQQINVSIPAYVET